MKKFLVLSLTIICMLTLVLVSCNNNNNTTKPIDDEDDIPVGLLTTSFKSGTGSSTNPTEWTEVDEEVWVVCIVRNRKKEKSKSSESLGACKLGEKYKRLGWDGDWSLIDFKGQQGYVLTAYLTNENGDIVFNNVNQIRIVTANEGWYLRQRPDRNKDLSLNIVDSSLLIAPKGTELKQTGISLNGKWARFEYKLTEDIGNLKAGETVTLYAFEPDASSTVKNVEQTTTTATTAPQS